MAAKKTRKKKDGRSKPRTAKQKAAAKKNGARLARWMKAHAGKTRTTSKKRRGPGRPKGSKSRKSGTTHHTKSVCVGNAVVTVSVRKS